MERITETVISTKIAKKQEKQIVLKDSNFFFFDSLLIYSKVQIKHKNSQKLKSFKSEQINYENTFSEQNVCYFANYDLVSYYDEEYKLIVCKSEEIRNYKPKSKTKYVK
jgi:hypothetical protein